MRAKTFAVIDTNVVVSAIMSDGYPNDIIEMVREGNIIPVFDKRMLSEYNEVLSRKKFGFAPQNIYDTLYNIVSNGILINDVEQAKAKFVDRESVKNTEVCKRPYRHDCFCYSRSIRYGAFHAFLQLLYRIRTEHGKHIL